MKHKLLCSLSWPLILVHVPAPFWFGGGSLSALFHSSHWVIILYCRNKISSSLANIFARTGLNGQSSSIPQFFRWYIKMNSPLLTQLYIQWFCCLICQTMISHKRWPNKLPNWYISIEDFLIYLFCHADSVLSDVWYFVISQTLFLCLNPWSGRSSREGNGKALL